MIAQIGPRQSGEPRRSSRARSASRYRLHPLRKKTAEIEAKDELRRRIDEAARYVDQGQLCLSHQCGFSSTVHGNLLSEADQWRKLERTVEVAREVWRG